MIKILFILKMPPIIIALIAVQAQLTQKLFEYAEDSLTTTSYARGAARKRFNQCFKKLTQLCGLTEARECAATVLSLLSLSYFECKEIEYLSRKTHYKPGLYWFENNSYEEDWAIGWTDDPNQAKPTKLPLKKSGDGDGKYVCVCLYCFGDSWNESWAEAEILPYLILRECTVNELGFILGKYNVLFVKRNIPEHGYHQAVNLPYEIQKYYAIQNKKVDISIPLRVLVITQNLDEYGFHKAWDWWGRETINWYTEKGLIDNMCDLIPVEKDGEFSGYYFDCPGCGENHDIAIAPHKLPNGASWELVGTLESPTIKPSIMQRIECTNGRIKICHFFVTNGKIEFLNDCTHLLAGKTVKMKKAR